MTTRFSQKAQQKIVLTEQQDNKFIAEELHQRELGDQRNELAKQQAEPFLKILSEQIEGVENPKDDWVNHKTIKDYQQQLVEESKRAIERLNHPTGHNIDWIHGNVKNIQELNTAIDTSRDILQKVSREIISKYRDELEPFTMPDPVDFITENKREEILKKVTEKNSEVVA